jgi:hypothetical protein
MRESRSEVRSMRDPNEGLSDGEFAEKGGATCSGKGREAMSCWACFSF